MRGERPASGPTVLVPRADPRQKRPRGQPHRQDLRVEQPRGEADPHRRDRARSRRPSRHASSSVPSAIPGGSAKLASQRGTHSEEAASRAMSRSSPTRSRRSAPPRPATRSSSGQVGRAERPVAVPPSSRAALGAACTAAGGATHAEPSCKSRRPPRRARAPRRPSGPARRAPAEAAQQGTEVTLASRSGRRHPARRTRRGEHAALGGGPVRAESLSARVELRPRSSTTSSRATGRAR